MLPYIKVDIDKINDFQQEVSNIGSHVNSISTSFSSISCMVDSDIKNSDGIRRKLQDIANDLSSIRTALSRTSTFLGNASTKYSNAERSITPQIRPMAITLGMASLVISETNAEASLVEESSEGFFSNTEEKSEFFKWKKGNVFEESLKDVEGKGNDYFKDKGWRKEKKTEKYIKRETSKDGKSKWVEIDAKDAPTFYDKEHTILEADIISGSVYGNRGQIGEREDQDGDGTFGYIAVAEGEAHGAISAGLYVLDGNGKKIFSPGVSAEVGASFSLVHAEGQWQALGNENLGLNLEGEVSLGKVETKAGIDFQVLGKEGLQVSVEAKAEAIAVEVEGSVGINVLGGEIEATGGINFGIGAHAEVGFRDGVFKCDIGASLGIGVSLDLEVDVGGMVSTVYEKAASIWDDAKDLLKGW